MKIGPIDILLKKNFTSPKKFYFISGNEITLIQKIKAVIIEEYQKLQFVFLLAHAKQKKKV